MQPQQKPTESYDWVDENDAPVGRGNAADGNARGYFTRSVHILLENESGELLICKRSSSKRTYPGLFTSSAGGHVEAGEAYEEAAHRELTEELGIDVKLTDAGRFDVVNEHERTIHHLFVGTIPEDMPIAADPNEVDSSRFISISALWGEALKAPEKFAPPFLGAMYQYVSREKGRIFVLDFDHTLFDWYRCKQDLETLLETKLLVPASIFREAKSLHEDRDGLYHMYRHVEEVAKLSGMPREHLEETLQAFLESMPRYLFPDAQIFLERLKQGQNRAVLLTYGDAENQSIFIRATGISDFFGSILYAETKEGKVDHLRELLKMPNALVLVNDDPKETTLIFEQIPLIQKIYVVERPTAKFPSIPPQPYYSIVARLTDVPV